MTDVGREILDALLDTQLHEILLLSRKVRAWLVYLGSLHSLKPVGSVSNGNYIGSYMGQDKLQRRTRHG